MATKRKRGNTWHYTVRRRGLLPKPLYLSFTDELEGDLYIERLEKLLDRGIVPDELKAKERAKLRDLIQAYLDSVSVSESDEAILTCIRPSLTRHVQGLDYAWAEVVVNGMKEKQLAPNTIRHHVGALARCLDWAMRRGDIDSNPLRLLPNGYSIYKDGSREDQCRDRRLEPQEEQRIRHVLAGGHKPSGKQRELDLVDRDAYELMFDLALETAMRMREIYTLDVSQVDIARRTIFLIKTKNGDKRQVPMSSVAVAAVERYWKERSQVRTGTSLLPFFDGGDPARTTSRLSRQWKRIFEHAGCEGLNFHDLRHHATCQFFLRTKLSQLEIALITGHKDLKMLKRYSNLRGSELALHLW